MYRTGALVVHSSKVLLPALAAASRMVSGVLYVPLAYQPSSNMTGNGDLEADRTQHEVWNQCETMQQIKHVYFQASRHSPLLDVRIVLPHPNHAPLLESDSRSKILEYSSLDVLLSSIPTLEEVKRSPGYLLLAGRTTSDADMAFKSVSCIEEDLSHAHSSEATPTDCNATVMSYSDIALGGTFDNIHNGHRLLLAQSALLAQRRIVVGVSTGPLLANKALTELIKPIEVRLSDVQSFLSDVRPSLKLDVVPITDVYGPTAWDEDLEGLVVSQETSKGGAMVNEERKNRGLKPLSVHIIDLIDRTQDSKLAQEIKLSSSDIRRSMLGSFREAKETCCLKSHDPSSGPYLIGLTGGIATGKSSIFKKLTAMGAYAIDCDKLGHLAYEPHTATFTKLVEEFGEDIIDKEGKIDRRILGPMVFKDKTKLEKLNSIVWPEIWRLVTERISIAHSKGHRVCVVDAAVMLKAGWQKHLHEVWVTIAPEKEVVQRVMKRDGVGEDAARRRMAAQLVNEEYVLHANVIFSTQWEPEYTQKQVEKAWSELLNRITTMTSKI